MSGLNFDREGLDWPYRHTSRFVDAAGLRWHVQTMGEGPPLVLVHGTGAATHSWRGLMPLLAAQFTVVAFDLPGHAFTRTPPSHRLSLPGMAADIAQLLRTLGVTPEIVVGHSAGAAILARMCLDGRIAPRILISLNGAFLPFGGVAGHLFSPLAKLLALNPLMPRLFAWQASSPGAVERLLRDTGSAVDPASLALYGKLVRSPEHVAAALRMMANWRLEPLVRDLPKLTPKLVLIAAANDRSISPRVAQQVRTLLPQAVIEALTGLGHLAHEEQPQQIADIVQRYAQPTSIRKTAANM